MSASPLNFEVNNNGNRTNGPRVSKKVREAQKKDVVKTLRSIAKSIASSRWCSSIECRAKAKVPIINFVTSFGVEGDVGCSGSMGVDTSDYSSKLVKVRRRREAKSATS